MSIKIYSPIKINLTLRVLDRLSNGYHKIFSLFIKKRGIEGLTISPVCRKNIADILSTTGMVFNGKNLIDSAMELIRGKGCDFPSLDITLKKSIPTGSGIGAGSGNVAALLRWIEEEYGVYLSSDELKSLGADVPFMMSYCDSAYVRGIGEDITPVNKSLSLYWGLVFPFWKSSTPDAYKAIDEKRIYRNCSFDEASYVSEAEQILSDLSENKRVGLLPNDFFDVLLPLYPEYRDALSVSEKSDALAWGLSGSGSSFFILSENKNTIKECLDNLGSRNWVKQTLIME